MIGSFTRFRRLRAFPFKTDFAARKINSFVDVPSLAARLFSFR
jgi:hypothetical protein